MLLGLLVCKLRFFASLMLTLFQIVILLLQLLGSLSQVLILLAKNLVELGLVGQLWLRGARGLDWVRFGGNGSSKFGGCGCVTAEGFCVILAFFHLT